MTRLRELQRHEQNDAELEDCSFEQQVDTLAKIIQDMRQVENEMTILATRLCTVQSTSYPRVAAWLTLRRLRAYYNTLPAKE